MTAHHTGYPPCPSSAPCAACAWTDAMFDATYEPPDSDRETITSPPPDFDDHERAPILPGDLLLGQWEEAEHGR